jgi:hypothetical protein
MDGKKAMETVSDLRPGIFFIGVSKHGVFLTTDNDSSWTEKNSGLPNTWALRMAQKLSLSQHGQERAKYLL